MCTNGVDVLFNCGSNVGCAYQGVNVREKAKQLVTLLKDEERLREERIHALKTKEKMAQTTSGEYSISRQLSSAHLLRTKTFSFVLLCHSSDWSFNY